jgi:hypothetical protein
MIYYLRKLEGVLVAEAEHQYQQCESEAGGIPCSSRQDDQWGHMRGATSMRRLSSQCSNEQKRVRSPAEPARTNAEYSAKRILSVVRCYICGIDWQVED